LVVLTVASLAPGAPKKNEEHEITQVCQHTYDEVFQASQDAIERAGFFVTAKDKDKGTISGNGAAGKFTFEMYIEPLNTKPETRVTMHGRGKHWDWRYTSSQLDAILSELQKVLATYH
jgi:hypothetical protein